MTCYTSLNRINDSDLNIEGRLWHGRRRAIKLQMYAVNMIERTAKKIRHIFTHNSSHILLAAARCFAA